MKKFLERLLENADIVLGAMFLVSVLDLIALPGPGFGAGFVLSLGFMLFLIVRYIKGKIE